MFSQNCILLLFFFVQIIHSLARVTDEEYDLMPELFHFDNYDICIFHGVGSSYCVATIQLRPENPKNGTQIWKTIEEVSSDKYKYRHDRLRHGICIKQLCATCNGTVLEAVNNIYGSKYKNMGLIGEVAELRCEDQETAYITGPMDIIFGAFGVVYTLFVVLVTFTFMFRNSGSIEHDKLSPVGHFFSSFSVSENWKILTKIDPKVYKENFVPSMQGVRFICTVWIIYVHTAYAIVAIPVANPTYVEELPSRFITSYHSNGGVLVQIFFVMSSWLLVGSMAEKVEKSGKIGFGYLMLYIFARYFRLAPLMILVVALHSTLLVHTYRGPFWHTVIGKEYITCRHKWWQNILFVNNFDTSDGICMLQSWYLSADFQLFALSTLILWLIGMKQKTLYVVTGLVILVYTVVVCGVLFWNSWEISIKFVPELFYNSIVIYSSQWNFTWASTYSGVPGYAVGLIFGHIFWKYKDQKLFPKKYHVTLVWSACLVLVPGILLSYCYYITTDLYSTSPWFGAIFGSLFKPLFASGIALMLLGMSQGLGSFLRKLFEYPLFHIMAQLSYGAFIVHFTVINYNVASRKSPPFVSDYFLVKEIIVNVSESYMISLGLTLFVQMPFTLLSKKMLLMWQ